MEKQNLADLTDEQLLVEKEKLRKSKITHALLIGFLAGILIFGLIAWILSPEKQIGFFIPMLLPLLFIYRAFKKGRVKSELEEILKERNLH
jgi:type IV secretory pathway TrbD component